MGVSSFLVQGGTRIFKGHSKIRPLQVDRQSVLPSSPPTKPVLTTDGDHTRTLHLLSTLTSFSSGTSGWVDPSVQ